MKLISKIIVGTTCLTIFSGTAYVVAISLAPPPNYTVSNAQRIKSYDDLSVNNAYEKRTRSQEFYLGLSRWRRKMIKEEGFLTGRVLEVGAGCGGNVAYYPKSFLTEDEGIRQLLRSNVESGSGRSEADGDTSGASYVLSRIGKSYPCDEIVLCDRSPGMVESCIQKVQSRFGYTPYRYPDYDRELILSMLKKEHDASADDSSPKSTPIRKRKVIQGDGTVRDVFLSPVVESGDEELLMDQGKIVAPILNAGMPGSGLPLLSKDGERELSRREKEMEHRYEFREMLQKLSDRFVQPEDNGAARDKREADGKSKRTAVHDQLVSVAKDSKSFLQAPQPIFSVANYAAEQLPFPDNSFDTVVDMFGLCSYDDPVRALRELSRVCKPGGTLLLIEHGKGDTPRVNNHLDKWAPRHAKNWGCWWNRDIRRVIRLSGLTISKWDNKHFGTSHYIIAKPYKSMQEWEAYNEGH